MSESKILYDFKNKKIKLAAHIWARQNNTSIQQMIEEAMVQKFPKLMKS